MTETLAPSAPAPLDADPPVTPRAKLARQFAACELMRAFRRKRYDPGERLELSITGVVP